MKRETRSEQPSGTGPAPGGGSPPSEWLVTGIGGGAPGDPAAGEGDASEWVELRLQRMETAVDEARRDARTAIAHAEEAVNAQQEMRHELDILRRELAERQQIALAEGLALEKIARESTASEKLTVPPAPPETRPPHESFDRIAGATEQRVHQSEHRIAAAEAAVQSLIPKAPIAEERESHAVDLNRVGFEQLREMGLSVTEVARVLARRDGEGDYTSLDQLDEVIELPGAAMERLKRRLQVF